MKKILVVFGTRPEAIKMAPVIRELQKFQDIIDTKVCVTGQHREMLDQVLHLFEIRPDYDLNIMTSGQDLYDVTSRVLLGMREVLSKESPDAVLVHGDTTTSMAAALAAFYKQIPVGHIEAGLRTLDIYSPWPEEANRQITDRIAAWYFAPTESSKNNLISENVAASRIAVTGNTVIDSLHWVVDRIQNDKGLEQSIVESIKESGYDVTRLSGSRRLVLITGHRRENFGNGMASICNAIKYLSSRYADVDFVYPMHLNPNVRMPIREVFGDNMHIYDNLFFIEPLEYLQFVYLMERSYIVLTDSGGIQEEAPGLGKPVLVMRDTTERPEAVAAGTVKLVGSDYNSIVSSTVLLLEDPGEYNKMSNAVNPYGEGDASSHIVNKLLECLA